MSHLVDQASDELAKRFEDILSYRKGEEVIHSMVAYDESLMRQGRLGWWFKLWFNSPNTISQDANSTIIEEEGGAVDISITALLKSWNHDIRFSAIDILVDFEEHFRGFMSRRLTEEASK